MWNKKWKKWSVVTTVIMAALLLVLSPASALAQTDEGTASGPRPFGKGALAIVAPGMAGVNQEISMTVFLRSNQEPFPGSGVWVFTQDEAEALREGIKALRENTDVAPEDKDYEAVADVHGRFLGRTDENGRLYHSFGEGGTYVLAAFHKGYFPGFSGIHIREFPRALAIEAPKRAAVGEEVIMTVSQRGTADLIEGAGVWAITQDNVEVFRGEMTLLNENTDVAAEDKDYAAVISTYGIFLGQTDANGQLSHAFAEEGGYALVTVLAGYHPGFTGIHIGDPPKGLVIHAPQRAKIGEEVLMTVSQRGTDEAVEGAGVWAITKDNAEVLREEMTLLRENKDVAAEDKDYESLAGIYGIFLGRTDGNGQLSYAFAEGGGYMLLTIKPGYFPGATGIHIGDPPKGLAIRAPRRAHVGDEVTMTVLERGSEEPLPVEGAGVWVIGLENAETLREDLSTLSHDSSISPEEKDFESLASVYGYFIGYTDANGQLSHAFETEGGYLLITIKSGYFPGLAPIHIVNITTKADELRERGVPGNGIDRAPGLQKPVPEHRPDNAPDLPIPDNDTTDA